MKTHEGELPPKTAHEQQRSLHLEFQETDEPLRLELVILDSTEETPPAFYAAREIRFGEFLVTGGTRPYVTSLTSRPYVTSLTSCSCAKKPKPCKHIDGLNDAMHKYLTEEQL